MLYRCSSSIDLFAVWLVAVLAGALAVAALAWPQPGGAELHERGASFVLDGLHFQSGDVVFRRGQSLQSRVVLAVDRQSSYSHVGILHVEAGRVYVVHAAPPETSGEVQPVLVEAVADFFAAARATRGAILRPTNSAAASVAAEAAHRYAGEGVPFDASFDLDRPDAMYCTELVWRAFLEAGIDLVDGRLDRLTLPMRHGTFILPSSLYASRHLVSVYHLPQ